MTTEDRCRCAALEDRVEELERELADARKLIRNLLGEGAQPVVERLQEDDGDVG